MLTVCNTYTHTPTAHDVYIGRARGSGTNILQNEWSHQDNTKATFRVETREEAVCCFAQWLWWRIYAGDMTVISALWEIPKDANLICYCAPKACHGHVIAHAIEYLDTHGWPAPYGTTVYGDVDLSLHPQTVTLLSLMSQVLADYMVADPGVSEDLKGMLPSDGESFAVFCEDERFPLEIRQAVQQMVITRLHPEHAKLSVRSFCLALIPIAKRIHAASGWDTPSCLANFHTPSTRFLSNFSPARVVLSGETYATTEHAFQAAKTDDPAQVAAIQRAQTPADAKRLGRTVTLRLDWKEKELGVMADLISQKFRDATLARRLADTGYAVIVEGNTWYDTTWGICDKQGTNLLGLLLMAVRSNTVIDRSRKR